MKYNYLRTVIFSIVLSVAIVTMAVFGSTGNITLERKFTDRELSLNIYKVGTGTLGNYSYLTPFGSGTIDNNDLANASKLQTLSIDLAKKASAYREIADKVVSFGNSASINFDLEKGVWLVTKASGDGVTISPFLIFLPGNDESMTINAILKAETETTTKPGETTTPGQTTSPGETTTPGQTTSPGETTTPGQTTSPGETTTPGQTTSPGETTTPGQTTSPGETTTPGQTTSPGQTTTPGETTTDPGVTTTPHESKTTVTRPPGEDGGVETTPVSTTPSDEETTVDALFRGNPKDVSGFLRRAGDLSNTLFYAVIFLISGAAVSIIALMKGKRNKDEDGYDERNEDEAWDDELNENINPDRDENLNNRHRGHSRKRNHPGRNNSDEES